MTDLGRQPGAIAMGQQKFADWMQAVDKAIEQRCGMTSDDLPDWGYRDAFDSGVTPSKAARQAIAAAREF